ncbi:hypothetical protein VB712_01400 [Spirulina sp. CCNP1310]|nr:hypothetical protein [Spirulina sp. CCNP1310]MEA5417859.1 hypothetical protein [Spirulina sp. CCNP1310]
MVASRGRDAVEKFFLTFAWGPITLGLMGAIALLPWYLSELNKSEDEPPR